MCNVQNACGNANEPASWEREWSGQMHTHTHTHTHTHRCMRAHDICLLVHMSVHKAPLKTHSNAFSRFVLTYIFFGSILLSPHYYLFFCWYISFDVKHLVIVILKGAIQMQITINNLCYAWMRKPLMLTWKGAVNQESGREGRGDERKAGRTRVWERGWGCSSSSSYHCGAEKCCQIRWSVSLCSLHACRCAPKPTH